MAEVGGAPETFQMRQFKGANLVDARTSIEDGEFAWLEGAVPVGAGNVKILPGAGPVLATLPVPGATLWGFSLTRSGAQTPILYAVSTDGSIREIAQSGAMTTVCAAGTVTTACRLAQWQDTRILIVDPTKGYFTWDGTTFTTIDAAKTGYDVEVYAGRAWIVSTARTVTYTAPGTYSDFTIGNGSGAFSVNDPAFKGDINKLVSAFELLFIVGDAGLNSISNVAATGTAPNVLTTFSNVNVVSNVGSPFASSVVVYYRSLLFFAPYGLYALVGFTPQKLSGKIDDMLPQFTLGTDVPACTVSLYNVLAYAMLVTWKDPDTGANRPIILLLVDGKFAWIDGASVTWITTLYINGVPTLWSLQGSTIKQLFADTGVDIAYKIKTKFWDLGHARQGKQIIRYAIEAQIPQAPVSPTILLETENGSLPSSQSSLGRQLTFRGTSTIRFIGTSAIRFVSSGLQGQAAMISTTGHYFGFTISGNDPAWTLSGLFFQFQRGGEWDT